MTVLLLLIFLNKKDCQTLHISFFKFYFEGDFLHVTKEFRTSKIIRLFWSGMDRMILAMGFGGHFNRSSAISRMDLPKIHVCLDHVQLIPSKLSLWLV